MSPENHQPDAFHDDAAGREQASQTFWHLLATLLQWRRFIAAVTLVGAVGAVVISLMLPNWYAASARLLPPESGGGSALSASLLRGLPSAASALLGGSSGDYARYLTILSSRGMYAAVVDSFNLVEVYGTEGPTAREDAIGTLAENVAFPVDEEFEFLSVVAVDTDPERAAAMANFMVRQLNQMNARLATQSAGNYRTFVEARYRESLRDLDSLKNQVQRFQQQYGVFDLESQTRSFLEQAAQLRAQAIQLEIQYETLLSQYGPDNPQVEQVRQAMAASQRKYRDAMQGKEALMPVPQNEVPEVFRRYVDLEQERFTQERILEVIAPLYEQARFDEERKVEAVQVVDAAVPPAKKAKPRRSIICIVATLSAFLLALLFVLGYEAWKRTHVYVAERLRQAQATPVRPREEAHR